jgi:hypothetical protein
MGIKDYGKLTKLQIKPKSGEPFEVMFNPESYSETFSVAFQKVENVNSGLEEYRYTKTPPQDFKLKFIIDGTGVSEYSSSVFPIFKRTDKTVYEQVNLFLKMAWYPVNGKAQPLQIQWGNFAYSCMLKEVTINYSLFDRGGNPLRAELDATFISDPAKNEKEYQQRLAPEATPTSPVQTTTNGIVISVT